MKKHISIILCGILSAVVLHTCVQIEIWNYLAGGILPNHEGGKLRYEIGESESSWRKWQSIRTKDESLRTGRPLTKKEQTAFLEHSKDAKRTNKVVSWTSDMGILQYLLAPIAMVWSAILLNSSKTRRATLFVGIFAITNAISIALMLYRGYFND
jgi:hypothetical protein